MPTPPARFPAIHGELDRERRTRALAARSGARGVAVVALLAAAVVPSAASAKTLVGGAGPDRLVGSDPAGDLIVGGGGADTLIGGDGNDRIYGVRSGNDIQAGGGDNYVEGGTGDDRITAGNGANTIYGGTGHDRISAGNGNNYVDPGGAPDDVTLGDGNNVVNAGSGGLTLKIGNGSNVVYLLSGPDVVSLGSGVNQVFVSRLEFASIDCGGNPASTISVSDRVDPTGALLSAAVKAGKVKGCPNVAVFPGSKTAVSKTAGTWEVFDFVGNDGPDKLFGGHGGGRIDGKGGDNVLWADRTQGDGGAAARARTTRILAGNGNNIIYGGRGTNVITVGNGRNFIRAGQWHNTIVTGNGANSIRLQGKGKNTVTINGGSAYVESFANGPKPRVICAGGAKGIVVYGVVKPKTNCATTAPAKSEKGKQLLVAGIEPIPDSDSVVATPIVPGVTAGVARPAPGDLTA